MLKPFLRRIGAGRSLSMAEAEEAMGLIMAGEATPAQIGAFALGLRVKGETVEEIAGCATAMRARAAAVTFDSPHLIDTCGTGGDGASTFNISTAVAFVAAAGGATVAKHGNRAVSSRCGSADVVEALGARLDIGLAAVTDCLAAVGIGFLFAPHHHAALRHAAAPRRELGVRTIFNILGPLSNPAFARRQLLGVFDADLTRVMAEVLGRMGSTRAFIVHGRDGLDEISISGPTLVAELRDGAVLQREVAPEMFGLARGSAEALRGGDAAHNAALIRDLLGGRLAGPALDIVLLNAGAALVAAGVASDWEEGISRARQVVAEGRALATLDAFVRRTQDAAGASGGGLPPGGAGPREEPIA